jgi:hypothetical protein
VCLLFHCLKNRFSDGLGKNAEDEEQADEVKEEDKPNCP